MADPIFEKGFKLSIYLPSNKKSSEKTNNIILMFTTSFSEKKKFKKNSYLP